MRIQVLGPVRAWRDGAQVDLGPAGQRAVLGLLALAGGQPLPRAELVDTLWGGRPPASAANIIQTYVKHLRRLLEPGRTAHTRSAVLPKVGDGYALCLPADDVDLVRFRRLVTRAGQAQRAGDQARVAALLAEALALWQGTPLVDVPALAGHPKVVALVAERRAVLAGYGEALLAAGAVGQALPVLAEAAGEAPLDEAAQARLIRAYQAAGRRAQAFEVYHQTRRRLAEELGVDPGPELFAAHAALLHDSGAPVPAPPAPAPAGAPGTVDTSGAGGGVEPPPAPAHRGPARTVPARTVPARTVPAQLPADIAAFTGRTVHLQQLDRLLPADHDTPPASVVIVAIEGSAGVGKTTLAVHWAHRVATWFPDGQLYLNLRGFDPHAPAMPPGEAIRTMLDALGVPAARIPVNLQAQAGLVRSLLAGRRVLIVLDNARDAGQVRPLLPGTPGALVLITSRNQLSGLVATTGAHPLTLGLLSTAEAHQLLADRLGAARTRAEPAAVADIVTRCARLPLALAIVAARAATHPAFPLNALAEQLRHPHERLDAFADPDDAADVRNVFSWSYQALGSDAAELFRLLGLHPGPDVVVAAAASLAGLPVPHAQLVLAKLARCHLVTEHLPGRYALHDLLRAYAAELCATVDSDAQRRAALRRMLDHYLHTAHRAAALLHPQQDLPTPVAAGPPVAAEQLADPGQALAWYTAEHPVLLAAVEQAAGTGFDAHAWQLALALAELFDRQGHWPDLATTQQTALRAAQRAGDRLGQAHAHRGLARACARLDRPDEADEHLRHAARLYRELGDRAGQARTHIGLAWMSGLRERHREALRHTRRALELYRAAGHRPGLANAQNTAGWFHAQLGDYRQALVHCGQALALYQELGDQPGQADTWDSLGYAHHHLDRHQQAVTCYRHALQLYRQAGDRYHEAGTLTRLGDTHRAAGDPGATRHAWNQALSILDELGHPDAGQVRTRLAVLDSSSAVRGIQVR